MIRPALPAAILLPLLLLPACYEETFSGPALTPGTYAGVFVDARIQTTEGTGDPVDVFEDVPFSGVLKTFTLSAAESDAYCFYEGGALPSSTYALVCNYAGPSFSVEFQGDQLYAGHPAGMLLGPGTELEIWGQYNPVVTTEEEVFVTPTPAPTPTPGDPLLRAEEDPTPTPEGEMISATCTRAFTHSIYGQLLGEDAVEAILTVVDTTRCAKEGGEDIPSAYRRVVFEAMTELELQ